MGTRPGRAALRLPAVFVLLVLLSGAAPPPAGSRGALPRPPGGDGPGGRGYWFVVMVYGMAMGLVASGVYDAVKKGMGDNKE